MRQPYTNQQRLEMYLAKMKRWSHVLGQDHLNKVAEEAKRYIKLDEGVDIFEAQNFLGEWAMADRRHALYLIEKFNEAQPLFYRSSQRELYALMFEILDCKRYGTTAISHPDDISNDILCSIAMGQIGLAKQFTKLVVDALDKNYGISHGIVQTGRYSAMALSIVSEYFEIPTDLDALKLPRDPAWMPIVQHWDTTDMDKIYAVLTDACEIHLSRSGLTDMEFDSPEFEFNSPYEALYPAEILAVLQLRTLSGLENPQLDHPLMNTPYAKLTSDENYRAEPDEMLEAILMTARKRDADIMEQWDKFAEK